MNIVRWVRAAALGLVTAGLVACGGGGGGSEPTSNPPPAPAPAVAIKAVQPQSPVAGQSVSMAAQGEGSGLSYSWAFGDGATADGANVSHTFSQPGSYTATVTVKDSTGRSATATANITVSAPALTAVVTASSKEAAAGQLLSFTAQQLPQAGVTYRWSFGDAGKAEGLSVNHRFLVPGTYTVMLTTSNAEGQSATASVTVLVTGTGPAIGVGQDAAVAGLAYDLRVTGLSEPSGVDVAWDFGDGTGQLGVAATHTYVATGAYTARAQLYGSNGSIYDLTRTITVVSQGLPGELTLQIQGDSVTKVGSQATWRLLASAPLQAVDWSFGDGTQGYGEIASHAYAAAGDYTVTVKATDTAGRKTSASTQISIRVELPTATITGFSPAAPRAGVAVQFNGTGTGDLAGAQAYEWHFGDGATATGSNPSHTYQSAGSYSVVLVARDRSGLASAPATATITVLPALPNAPSALVIKPSQLVLGVSAQVSFAGEAVGTGALTYQWQFGDGNVATGPQASHRYGRAGTFNVVMTVTDPEGQQSSASATLVVSPYQTLNLFSGNIGGFGYRDGLGADARFWSARDIAQLNDGSFLIADGSVIRKMTSTGVVTTYYGQPSDVGYISGIMALTVAPDGAVFYIDSCTVNKLSPDGLNTLIAGSYGYCGDLDGTGVNAQLNFWDGGDIEVAENGEIYVVQPYHYGSKIKKITRDGQVITIAGRDGSPYSPGPAEGPALDVYLGTARSLALSGGEVYVLVGGDVKKIDTQGNVVFVHKPTTPLPIYQFDSSFRQKLIFGPAGRMMFTDGCVVREVRSFTESVPVFASKCPTSNSSTDGTFLSAGGFLMTDSGEFWIADLATIKRVSGGVVTTVAGLSPSKPLGPILEGDDANAINPGNVLGIDRVGRIYSYHRCSNAPNSTTTFILRRLLKSGASETMTTEGGGGWRASSFQDCVSNYYNDPALYVFDGGVVSPDGELYFNAAWPYGAIFKLNSSGQISLLAGSVDDYRFTGMRDGLGGQARFAGISSMTMDRNGKLIVLDQGAIREVAPDGMVTTFVGPSVGWYGFIVVADDGTIYTTDSYSHAVWKITPDKKVFIFAGQSGQSGFADGFGSMAKFSSFSGLALDSKGNLYVADSENRAIRRIDGQGNVVTIIGGQPLTGIELGALPARIDRPWRLFTNPEDQLLIRTGDALLLTGGL